jgi:signal peptidase II
MHVESAINLWALLTVLLLDQASKSAVHAWLGMRSASLGSWMAIRLVSHHRGIYRGRAGRALLVSIWLATLVALLLPPRSLLPAGHFSLGVAIALGGAAGNLVDILWLGYVVDFVDLGWWPVFNLSDASIILGLLLALWA